MTPDDGAMRRAPVTVRSRRPADSSLRIPLRDLERPRFTLPLSGCGYGLRTKLDFGQNAPVPNARLMGLNRPTFFDKMNTPRHDSHLLEAEAAASRVLEAERAARAQVAQCEVQCARLVGEANARAQALRWRTEARIERLRARMTAAAEKRVHQIRTEEAVLAGESGIDAATLARLDAAIEQLVAEIAGEYSESSAGCSD